MTSVKRVTNYKLTIDDYLDLMLMWYRENLVMLAIIGITYVLISVFLVAGVKILNMAYLGNAIFLSG